MSAAPETSRLLTPRKLIVAVVWALALFSILQIRHYERLFGHAICGPWGCGPPVSALVGYHGFWFLLILPMAAILKRRLCRATARSLGLGLMLLSGVGIVSLLLLEGLNNSAAEKYLLRWSAFRVATFVDLPLVQLGLAGLWLCWTKPSVITKTNPDDDHA